MRTIIIIMNTIDAKNMQIVPPDKFPVPILHDPLYVVLHVKAVDIGVVNVLGHVNFKTGKIVSSPLIVYWVP